MFIDEKRHNYSGLFLISMNSLEGGPACPFGKGGGSLGLELMVFMSTRDGFWKKG